MPEFFKFKEFPFGKVKTVVHALQAILVFIAWILAIVLIAKPGGFGSAIGFYLFLTWISIPALLYLAVVPRLQQFKRFENAYANAALDVVFFIFWLAGFASVFAWTSGGIKDSEKGCESFSFGDTNKCQSGYAAVVIGVMITLLWLVAAAVSVYSLLHFRKHGYLPNSRPSISEPTMSEPKIFKKEKPMFPKLHRDRTDEEHGSVQTETEDGIHPGRKLSWGQSPPMTAPSRFELGLRPQFRPVSYGDPTRFDEKHEFAPRRPPTRNATPPRLQLWGSDNNAAPALEFDYSNVPPTAKGPLDTRRGVLPPFVSPRAANAISSSNAAFDVQPSVLRGPNPGPASRHNGGYNSAYHTPLPTGMVQNGNSWRDDMMRGYSGQPLDFPKGDYSR